MTYKLRTNNFWDMLCCKLGTPNNMCTLTSRKGKISNSGRKPRLFKCLPAANCFRHTPTQSDEGKSSCETPNPYGGFIPSKWNFTKAYNFGVRIDGTKYVPPKGSKKKKGSSSTPGPKIDVSSKGLLAADKKAKAKKAKKKAAKKKSASSFFEYESNSNGNPFDWYQFINENNWPATSLNENNKPRTEKEIELFTENLIKDELIYDEDSKVTASMLQYQFGDKEHMVRRFLSRFKQHAHLRKNATGKKDILCCQKNVKPGHCKILNIPVHFDIIKTAKTCHPNKVCCPCAAANSKSISRVQKLGERDCAALKTRKKCDQTQNCEWDKSQPKGQECGLDQEHFCCPCKGPPKKPTKAPTIAPNITKAPNITHKPVKEV